MNSSGNTTRSAPSSRAWARAARALSALPAMSPTVGLSCASVTMKGAGSVMQRRSSRVPALRNRQAARRAPSRSAIANSQNSPASTSATPTAAEPMSLTRPICGSCSVVRRSASFSIAVLSSSTTSTSTTTAISSTARITLEPTRNASGSASSSAISSSRTACFGTDREGQSVPGVEGRPPESQQVRVPPPPAAGWPCRPGPASATRRSGTPCRSTARR